MQDAKFFDKNVTFVALKLSLEVDSYFAFGQCVRFSVTILKKHTQNGQNQSCDTIALKRRYIFFINIGCAILYRLSMLYITL